MSETIDDQYLDWLYEMVCCQDESVNHFKLMKHLLSREFVMIVPNDDNRCEDGIALRREFAVSRHIETSNQWISMDCSVLEMLIGVARHLSFEMDGDEGEWFWHLIENLGLTRYNDRRYNQRVVDQTIERLVWREYSYDGTGGLFPLEDAYEDQRNVEIWFQMEAYMLELERSG